jgi:carboxymethylenebutenolidase
MGEIRIPVSSGELPVYVTAPEQGAPWPSVVIVHDVADMTEDLRNQTRWLAEAGFLAAAPNLLFRGGKMKCLFAIARDLRAAKVRPTTTWKPSANGSSRSQTASGRSASSASAWEVASRHS